MNKSGIKISKELRSAIRKRYLESDLTMNQVAKEFGVGLSVTYRAIHEFDGQEKITTMLRNKQIDCQIQTGDN